MKKKKCSDCRKSKPVSDFGCYKTRGHKPNSICKRCNAHRCKERRDKIGKAGHSKEVRRSFMKRIYGITLEQYEKMRRVQRFRCAICRKHEQDFARQLAVDHCHKTGKVRGLLCSRCNVGIGQFKESRKILRAALKYLMKHKGAESGSKNR